ncbi:MAG: hypothetical protein QXJ32_01430 [Thermoplasmata archaeon]
MKTEGEDDLPTIVAAITLALPSVALRTGLAYLRMKRRARRVSRIIERNLVANGVPREAAQKLAESVNQDISIRALAARFGAPLLDR